MIRSLLKKIVFFLIYINLWALNISFTFAAQFIKLDYMESNEPIGILEQALLSSESFTEKDYKEGIDYLVEEQPVMARFLMNLSDEFSEEMHDFTLLSSLVILRGFKIAGLTVNAVEAEALEKLIEEKVGVYDKFEDDHETFTVGDLVPLCDSPMVMNSLLHTFLDQEMTDEAFDELDLVNFALTLDIIITALEQSIGLPDKKNIAEA